jgi:hypothetical protein
MTRVTVLAERRKNTPEARRDLAEWLQAADAEVARTSRNPNEILDHLLAAGCKVAFVQCAGTTDIMATVTMPGCSTVSETGLNAVAALVFAYGSGAWLADLPAALTATAEPSKGAS